MRLTRLYYDIFPRKFGTYWEKIKNKSNLDDDIKNITNSFIKSESYKYVSHFWHILNKNNYQSLLEKGLITGRAILVFD